MSLDNDTDGFMIETHINPDVAWSDARQQVTPLQLDQLLKGLSYRNPNVCNKSFETALEELRGEIDAIDSEIIEALHLRKIISQRIGLAKAQNNITPLQLTRMNELLLSRVETAQKLGLRSDFIKDIYNTIHEESIKIQSEVM